MPGAVSPCLECKGMPIDEVKAMLPIELEPDLSSCIHTVAKREYDRTLRELLQVDSVDEALQKRLETLKLFLETEDFSRLRSEYERHLLEGRQVKFVLQPGENRADYKIEIT